MLVVSWLGVNLGCDNRLRLTISNLIRPFSISFHSSPKAVGRRLEHGERVKHTSRATRKE